MMILEETYTLQNDVKIPKLGLGTWFIPDESAAEAVREAVVAGYRHIDTAQAYGNETGIGEGIRNSGISRKEIFVTSKVAAEHKSYEAARVSIDESLSKMGLDYIDMILIHSPQPWKEWRSQERYFEENKEVWRALEDAYGEGKLRAVGVSNFLEDDLESLLADCRIKPMVNQVLAHIGNTPLDLVEFCRKQNILVEAYSPIAHGEALKNQTVTAMAEKYGVSTAQLCIKYVLTLGMVALPKTGNPKHMKNNAEMGFDISEKDMDILKKFDLIQDYGEYSHFPVFSGK